MVFSKPNPSDPMTDHAEQHGFAFDETNKLKVELEDHTHDDYASKEEFDDLKAEVDELKGGETPEPEPPEGPHWEFSYTNKFVRGQDGARWDNGGQSVGEQNAWLPDQDAEGNRFITQAQYEVKVEDGNGNKSSWSNYRATYFPQNSVNGYLIDFEAYGETEGDILYYEPSRKWVSGNRSNDKVINHLLEELENLKKLVAKQSEGDKR